MLFSSNAAVCKSSFGRKVCQSQPWLWRVWLLSHVVHLWAKNHFVFWNHLVCLLLILILMNLGMLSRSGDWLNVFQPNTEVGDNKASIATSLFLKTSSLGGGGKASAKQEPRLRIKSICWRTFDSTKGACQALGESAACGVLLPGCLSFGFWSFTRQPLSLADKPYPPGKHGETYWSELLKQRTLKRSLSQTLKDTLRLF